MRPLTIRQNEMLDHIRRYRKITGMSPSIRDLMKLMNLRSTSTVHQHLMALERKGCIRIHGHKGIQLLAEPEPLDGLVPRLERAAQAVGNDGSHELARTLRDAASMLRSHLFLQRASVP